MLDYVLTNGKIVDGSGNPWYWGSIGIKDGILTGVGRIDQEAREMIDVHGAVISPGFIDSHTHSDLMILHHPKSEIKLQQGVTTEVVGNCGLAPAPMNESNRHLLERYIEPVVGKLNPSWHWEGVGDYIRALQQTGISENIATFVAHGSLRIAAMGFENRPASKTELARMKQLLEEGMAAGAIGLSIGLLYAPGSYSTKEEISELCSVLPKYDGLLATHIRGEGNSLIESIKEVIWIAHKAGIPLHISHLKAAGRRNWGMIMEALELIEQARIRGLDVTCDVYPYHAGSTTLTTILPPWTLEGGILKTLETISDPAARIRIMKELAEEQDDWDNLVCSTGWEQVIISSVQTEANRHLEGRSMAELAELRGKHPAECMMDLLIEEKGYVSIVYFHMSEDDVLQVVASDRSLIASDSLQADTGKPHPRLYGTFPRLFGSYVRDKKALTLEQAVRKVTSFPASRFRLGKRGLLVPGYAADLTVFHPNLIQDKATFESPRQYPEGISYVFVNGVKTMNLGQHTHQFAGSFISAQHIHY